MIELKFTKKSGVFVEEEESIEKLEKNFFGKLKNKKIFLDPEEALYLINFQNAQCFKGKKELGFSELASFFIKKESRLFIKYNAFRDWRDRGLIIKKFSKIKKGKRRTYKKYPSSPVQFKKYKANAYWFPDSKFSIIENKKIGFELFSKHWIGQFGIYKQTRGELLKLNFIETIFLAKHLGVKIIDIETGKKITEKKILSQIEKREKYAKQMYEVYEDWRLAGFIVKTGFKFGSNFRIYFKGVSPVGGKYIHSRHVLHSFPKEQKLLVSEWARAVRVAHGVKKTFLLGVPKLTGKDLIDYPADYIAHRRKRERKGKWVRETPNDKPRYLLAAVSEDDYIGGIELVSLLEKAKKSGLELILSITDRESAITYYLLKKIILQGSNHEYYEILWMKP